MRTAIAVVAVLMAAGLSGCAMSPDGCGSCSSTGMFSGRLMNQGCGGCETDCNDCGSSCGGCSDCSTGYSNSMFPGPMASWRMGQQSGDCNSCDTPRLGMGQLAMFARNGNGNVAGNGLGCGRNGCGLRGGLCGECNLAARMRGRVEQFKNRERISLSGALASTEPVMNETRGGLLSGIAMPALPGGCGPDCASCGGRGCGPRLGGLGIGGLKGDPAAQHPYGGQIPHTDGFQGPHGPVSPTYAYPYYTTRGPRDFFVDDPPTIGR